MKGSPSAWHPGTAREMASAGAQQAPDQSYITSSLVTGLEAGGPASRRAWRGRDGGVNTGLAPRTPGASPLPLCPAPWPRISGTRISGTRISGTRPADGAAGCRPAGTTRPLASAPRTALLPCQPLVAAELGSLLRRDGGFGEKSLFLRHHRLSPHARVLTGGCTPLLSRRLSLGCRVT